MKLYLHPVLGQGVQHSADQLKVLLEASSENQNVVDVNDHLFTIEVMKDFLHLSLERCRCVSQPEGQALELVMIPWG